MSNLVSLYISLSLSAPIFASFSGSTSPTGFECEEERCSVNLLQLPDSVILSSQSAKGVKEQQHVSGNTRWTPTTPTASSGACGHEFNFSHFDPQDPSWTADELITSWEQERAKLSVPFWMYDGMIGATDFAAAQAALQDCMEDDESHVRFIKNEHNGGELRIYQQLRHHPWRVAKSQDARIIVVPIVMTMYLTYTGAVNMLKEELDTDNNTEEFRCPGYNATEMYNAVVNSQLFSQRPKDHLWLGLDDLFIANILKPPWKDASIWAMQVTDSNTYEWGQHCRPKNHLVAPFDPSCTAGNTKTQPKVWFGNASENARAVSFFYGGKTYETGHKYYAVRKQLFNHRASMPERTVLVTNEPPVGFHLPDCHGELNATRVAEVTTNWTSWSCIGKYTNDILQQVQFAICPRGDNPSSPRLYHAMSFGAIPVFISDEAFLAANPFQCFVPYDQISVSITEADCFRDCGAALRNATGHLDAAALQRIRKLIRHFQKDLLWGMAGSRVAENLLLTAALRQRDPVITSCNGCCTDQSYPI